MTLSDSPRCEIDWQVSPEMWEARFARITCPSLLQHRPYARAVASVEGTGFRHGVIHIGGQEAGLVQVGETGALGNLLQAVSLDRGPAWFDDFGTAAHNAAFIGCFARRYRKRPGRKLRLLPELHDTPEARAMLTQAGYSRRGDMPGYSTFLLDLNRDLPALRAGLAGKWRNVLSKAERTGLKVRLDDKGDDAVPFLTAYAHDREAKGYDGPSIRLLLALVREMAPRGEVLILSAAEAGEDIAAVMILLHGNAATYQIGWSNPLGRRRGAHHLLLWQAVETLKERGIRAFDLGGYGEGVSGIEKFKSGMGGEAIRLAGTFC